MTVVCKENISSNISITSNVYRVNLTINKQYDVINETAYVYRLVDDKGVDSLYNINWFYSVWESRNIQIDKILW